MATHDDTKNQPRPLTRAELLQWLGNIKGMHTFAKGSTPGSASFMLYHDGMPEASEFIRKCVELTPEGTL